MTDEFNIRNEAMPQSMRLLLQQYPRENWEEHPGFVDKTRQWLRAHEMFRKLANLLRGDAEALLDRNVDAQIYAQRLSRFGNMLIGNLHGHHAWEDHEFFPELSSADPRFDRGLNILEKDHSELDAVLDAFANTGNRTIKLASLDESEMFTEVGKVHRLTETVEKFLARHLGDEEELAVPIILHHRLRG